MLFERPEIGESAVLVSVELDRFAAPDLDELVELSKSAGLWFFVRKQLLFIWF